MAAAAQIAFAGSDGAASSGAPRKSAAAATPHQSVGPAHRHTARPAPHQATSHKEQKKEIAARPATGSPAAATDKSLNQRPLLGPFSLGVETDEKVKKRSIRGGEYDPEKDGEPKGLRPPYLGLSLKSQFSW